MTTEIKQQIQTALEAYMAEHKLSQSEVAESSGVNAAYLINVRKGDYTIRSGDKTIDIADKYFYRIAKYIGFSAEKSYWATQATPQMASILAALQDAKDNGEAAVLIGETGSGKTFCCQLFQKRNPADVSIVTVGASDNLPDLLLKTIAALSIPHRTVTVSSRMRIIFDHLKRLSERGFDPMIIFDESEYMRHGSLCAMKEFYDHLNEVCSIVMIGTEQLMTNVERLKRKNSAGIPQLYRRIKYRVRRIPAVDRSFNQFLEGLEPGLKTWLKKHCDNYGELHDVLVPARREAERTGQPLTEDFVKMILGIA